MANEIKWAAAWTDRGDVLTTELNGVVDGARSNAGTEVANQTNLDQYGQLELSLTFGSAPGAGATVEVHQVTAPGGTNYADGSSTVDPGAHTLVATVPVRAVTTAQRLTSQVFGLEPAKTKFILVNRAGQALAASGNTVKLYTSNDEIQ